MNGYVRNTFRVGALLLVTAGCNEVLGLDPGTPATGGNAGEPMAGTGAVGATGGTASGTGASGGATNAGTGATSGDAGQTGQGGAGRGGSDSGGGGTGGFTRGTCESNADCIAQGFDWPGVCRSGRCID